MKTRHLLLLALATALAGCGPQSTLKAAGPAARDISHLGWTSIILFGATAVIMWALLAWTVLRRRGTLATHEPWNTGGGQKWILIGGFAIPFVVLSSMFGLTISALRGFPMHAAEHAKPDILVIGHQWWWEVHYIGYPPPEQVITANEIHIPTGRPVEIELQTNDVIHSFWVPALHGKEDLIPGQLNYIRLQADKPGNYEGQCGEYCGAQHAHMRLLVVAQSPQEFEAWHNAQLKAGAEPADSEAMHGREVFLSAPCALCHTVQGTGAQGKVAPDLTHIASRQYIGANTFPNNEANLEAWVTHAQSMKPGAQMPNLSAFDGADLRALVAYLRQLK